jgi:hypothetical protein
MKRSAAAAVSTENGKAVGLKSWYAVVDGQVVGVIDQVRASRTAPATSRFTDAKGKVTELGQRKMDALAAAARAHGAERHIGL